MNQEIEIEQLQKLNKDEIIIIDIRNNDDFSYGHIPGAINISQNEIFEKVQNLSIKKNIYLYCFDGNLSKQIAQKIAKTNSNCFYIKNGYKSWLEFYINNTDSEISKKAELSIRKTFHKDIFSKFAKAINTYKLLEPNDKVAVCISGGKDSMLMAKLFQELKLHNKFPFELVFLVMDPGYSPANRKIIEHNAKILNVPINVFETNIFENVFNIEKSPCYICARMRRGYLYSKAKELGCNKIALGHHFDDVIETILMGMLFGGQVQTMMPKLKSKNFDGMELIRPLYLIREETIKKWRDYNNLYFIQCACKFTETCYNNECLTTANTSSKRKQIKELISTLKINDPQIEDNIFKSVENVNLSTIVAYKDKNGVKHNFLDDYETTFD